MSSGNVSFMPADAGAMPPQAGNACCIVGELVQEVVLLVGDRAMLRRDRRRHACHIRQIAMYVCHVSLCISLSEIGVAFGRDRTTVGHACNVVEDRRDDPAFDELVGAVERIVVAVFGKAMAAVGGQEDA